MVRVLASQKCDSESVPVSVVRIWVDFVVGSLILALRVFAGCPVFLHPKKSELQILIRSHAPTLYNGLLALLCYVGQ